jgi:hypothetical protein
MTGSATVAAVPWTFWLGVGWCVVDAIVLLTLLVLYVRKVGRLEARWRRWQAEQAAHPSLPRSSA